MSEDRNEQGHIMWVCQCDCGCIKDIDGASLRSGNTQSCGCSNGVSRGELKICQILDEASISYIREYRPIELNGKRFDFAILDENNAINRLIEFDGEQHYKESRWERDKLERTKFSDAIKNQYAKDFNIPLVRIPYWEYKNLSYDLLFSDKFLI